MSDFTPTSEQVAALDGYATRGDLIIEAGAGTGKSATLKLIAESDPGRTMQYIAFNKAIVTEAQRSMPKNVTAQTAHSLAFRSTGYRYKARLDSDRMRSDEIAQVLGINAISVRGPEGKPKYLSESYLAGLAMRTITNFCQSADDELNATHVPRVLGIDSPDDDQNNRRLQREILPFVEKAWADIIETEGRLQFKHEHYLKIYQLSGPHIPADVILFDEAQDVAPVLAAIVGCQQHAQRVYVGDANQSIYGFTGAIDALAQLDADHRTSLTMSFRFGPAIAEIANRALRLLPTDMVMRGFNQIHSTVGPVQNADAILCRTNAMAVATLFAESRSGRRGHLVGGGREVIAFAKGAKALQDERPTFYPDLACFESWGQVQEYVQEDEQGDELKLLVDLVDRFTPGAIIGALMAMPKEQDADVVISTAHKAKGRQWDTVQLSSDFPDSNEEITEDELRLLYVAVTRARLRLDAQSVPWMVGAATLPAIPAPVSAPTFEDSISELAFQVDDTRVTMEGRS